jgi:hypothetical protein
MGKLASNDEFSMVEMGKFAKLVGLRLTRLFLLRFSLSLHSKTPSTISLQICCGQVCAAEVRLPSSGICLCCRLHRVRKRQTKDSSDATKLVGFLASP